MVKEYLYAPLGQEAMMLHANRNLTAGVAYARGRYLGTQTPPGFVDARQGPLRGGGK